MLTPARAPLVRAPRVPHHLGMVFWVVVGTVLIAGLAAAASYDRRVRARRARLGMAPPGEVQAAHLPTDPLAYWNPGPNGAGAG
jgi:hypothetical protein